MGSYDDFWGKVGDIAKKAGPGLFDFGMDMYGKRQANNELAGRLAPVQGPVFQQANAAASGMLGQVGNGTADSFAADRFNAGEGLVAPRQEADLNQLMRTLRAKGMLGVSSFEPATSFAAPGAGARTAIDGAVAPVDGQAMNPNIAAFYAAQNADRAKRAAASMGQGQDYVNNLVSRANTLTGTANTAQNTGLQYARTPQPSRGVNKAEMIRGGLGVLKQANLLQPMINGGIGMLGNGIDWLGKKTGWWDSGPELLNSFGD